MYAAVISDTSWLDEELLQFQALVAGLLDEQVRVAQVVPEPLDAADANAFGERVSWQDSSVKWLRTRRLSATAGALHNMGVDLVHAMDAGVWAGAIHVARKLNAPLVLGCNSADDADEIPRLRRSLASLNWAVAATTAPLGEALTRLLGESAVVSVIPPGVHHTANAPMPEPAGHALCAVITGDGAYDDQYLALLGAITTFIRDYPQAQFFLDGQQHDQHNLWLQAQKLGLLSNVSLVPRRLGHHELLLRADVLLQPQSLGQSRGLTLKAMAGGIPVVARADPWLDYLVPDQTAWIVDGYDPGAWDHHLRNLITNPDAARKLGVSARAWVREHHVASRQVDRTLTLYRTLTGETMKFSPRP